MQEQSDANIVKAYQMIEIATCLFPLQRQHEATALQETIYTHNAGINVVLKRDADLVLIFHTEPGIEVKVQVKCTERVLDPDQVTFNNFKLGCFLLCVCSDRVKLIYVNVRR